MRTIITLLALLGLLALDAIPADLHALDAASTASVNRGPDRVALAGHDPVAYFTVQRAVAGDPAFTVEHEGAVYRFASTANRDAFAARPAAYAPQYGGFCAFGAAHGGKYDIDPTQFRIVGGKLYLNKDAVVSRLWQQDIAGHIELGDTRWPAIRARAPQDLQ